MLSRHRVIARSGSDEAISFLGSLSLFRVCLEIATPALGMLAMTVVYVVY